jgi:hypothetical protein
VPARNGAHVTPAPINLVTRLMSMGFSLVSGVPVPAILP